MSSHLAIPPFDSRGNLSVGQLFGQHATGSAQSLVRASLAEIHARFVQNGHARRSDIWDGWMRHRQLLDRFPVPYVTLVNGSFVTNKPEPGDADLCVLYEAEAYNGMAPPQRADFDGAMDHARAKRDFLLDLYSVTVYQITNPRFSETTLRNLSYWIRVFGTSRLGYAKSLLAVHGGGVL